MKNNKDKLDELFEKLKQIRELRESLEEENPEEEINCHFIKEIMKDYTEFEFWVFGENMNNAHEKDTAVEIWKKRHPHLAVPRIMQSKYSIGANMNTMALLMDAYHYFLKEKENPSK